MCPSSFKKRNTKFGVANLNISSLILSLFGRIRAAMPLSSLVHTSKSVNSISICNSESVQMQPTWIHLQMVTFVCQSEMIVDRGLYQKLIQTAWGEAVQTPSFYTASAALGFPPLKPGCFTSYDLASIFQYKCLNLFSAFIHSLSLRSKDNYEFNMGLLIDLLPTTENYIYIHIIIRIKIHLCVP